MITLRESIEICDDWAEFNDQEVKLLWALMSRGWKGVRESGLKRLRYFSRLTDIKQKSIKNSKLCNFYCHLTEFFFEKTIFVLKNVLWLF